MKITLDKLDLICHSISIALHSYTKAGQYNAQLPQQQLFDNQGVTRHHRVRDLHSALFCLADGCLNTSARRGLKRHHRPRRTTAIDKLPRLNVLAGYQTTLRHFEPPLFFPGLYMVGTRNLPGVRVHPHRLHNPQL
jgi:hypothetical protein